MGVFWGVWIVVRRFAAMVLVGCLVCGFSGYFRVLWVLVGLGCYSGISGVCL